ncbi:hypothetical protein R3P38DRAFT_3250344 [Favolaschia claudopus]|uniref:Uncharacterized protein n=1 Tax=Favolaschia claudopus TaxID=2862362 RepID=A0AAW0EIL3_9AGAR
MASARLLNLYLLLCNKTVLLSALSLHLIPLSQTDSPDSTTIQNNNHDLHPREHTPTDAIPISDISTHFQSLFSASRPDLELAGRCSPEIIEALKKSNSLCHKPAAHMKYCSTLSRTLKTKELANSPPATLVPFRPLFHV